MKAGKTHRASKATQKNFHGAQTTNSDRFKLKLPQIIYRKQAKLNLRLKKYYAVFGGEI